MTEGIAVTEESNKDMNDFEDILPGAEEELGGEEESSTEEDGEEVEEGLSIDDLDDSEASEEEEEEDDGETGIEEIDALEIPEDAPEDQRSAFVTMRQKITEQRKELKALKEGNEDPEETKRLKEENSTMAKRLEAQDYKRSPAFKEKYLAPISKHFDVIKRTAADYDIPQEVLQKASRLKGRDRDELLSEHGATAATIIGRELSEIAILREKANDAVRNFDPTEFKTNERERLSESRTSMLAEAIVKASKTDIMLRDSKSNPDHLKGISDQAMKIISGDFTAEEQVDLALKASTSDKWQALALKYAQESGALKKKNKSLKKSRPSVNGTARTKKERTTTVNRSTNLDSIVDETMAMR